MAYNISINYRISANHLISFIDNIFENFFNKLKKDEQTAISLVYKDFLDLYSAQKGIMKQKMHTGKLSSSLNQKIFFDSLDKVSANTFPDLSTLQGRLAYTLRYYSYLKRRHERREEELQERLELEKECARNNAPKDPIKERFEELYRCAGGGDIELGRQLLKTQEILY